MIPRARNHDLGIKNQRQVNSEGIVGQGQAGLGEHREGNLSGEEISRL